MSIPNDMQLPLSTPTRRAVAFVLLVAVTILCMLTTLVRAFRTTQIEQYLVYSAYISEDFLEDAIIEPTGLPS